MITVAYELLLSLDVFLAQYSSPAAIWVIRTLIFQGVPGRNRMHSMTSSPSTNPHGDVCSRQESNLQLALRRGLLYPFNYENLLRSIAKTETIYVCDRCSVREFVPSTGGVGTF